VSIHVPASEAEVIDLVRQAVATREPLAIEGGATRVSLGRPVQTAATLSTRKLTGIVFYEPAEMVIRARAGTPVAEIEAALAEKGQALPFEPMDHRAVLGTQGEPTIGAVAACNISGPKRIRNGAARDSLIGVRFINGRGEAINSGGRVMKNVTGLDLVKLQSGAYGTLGVLSEVTFKVIPETESSGTLVIAGLDAEKAVTAMSAALGSPFEVSGAAYIPGDTYRTLLRIEHFAPSVDYRLGEIEKLLKGFGPASRLGHEETRATWGDIRDMRMFAAGATGALWRVSIAPSRAPGLLRSISQRLQDARYMLDWGGGLIWLAVPATGDASAQLLRDLLADTGGYATLVRAPSETRSAVSVFQPQSEALMKISQGIKASIDPAGIFNPGRMYAGL